MNLEKNFALMRHSAYNKSNQKITKEGKQLIVRAAEKLAHFLKKHEIDVVQIWHSPKERAQETAELMVVALNLEGIITDKISSKEFLDLHGSLSFELSVKNPIESEELFTLMVSHQPDIEIYLDVIDQKKNNFPLCGIFTNDEVINE